MRARRLGAGCQARLAHGAHGRRDPTHPARPAPATARAPGVADRPRTDPHRRGDICRGAFHDPDEPPDPETELATNRDLYEQFIAVCAREMNRRRPDGQKLVRIEVQRWRWRYWSDPGSGTRGQLVERHEYVVPGGDR